MVSTYLFTELDDYAMFLFPFIDVSFLCRYTVNLVVFFVDKKLTGEKEPTRIFSNLFLCGTIYR